MRPGVLLVAFEGQFHAAFLQHVVQRERNVVRVAGAVAQVVDVLCGKGLIAVAAAVLNGSLGIVQVNLGQTHVDEGVGRGIVRTAGSAFVHVLAYAEARVRPVGAFTVVDVVEA